MSRIVGLIVAVLIAACDESALEAVPPSYPAPSVARADQTPPAATPLLPSDAGAVELPDAALEADDEDCVELRAHGAQTPGDDSPFEVPPGESYFCFSFASPWPDAVQGVRHEPLARGEAVHHHLLYDAPALAEDGSFETCSGSHPNATLIPGWEPDNPDFPIAADVGFALPYGNERMFTLEIHYINTSDEPALDRSGVRVCATRTPRPHTASVTWLGTENIGGIFGVPPGQVTTVSGTCTPGRKGLDPTDSIHVLGSLPHMHALGRHMKTIVHRKGGLDVVLLDAPFDSGDPRGVATALAIEPGDTLETQCTYDNTTDWPVAFGPLSTQEMCFNFVIAYPAGALDNPSFSFSGALNTCLL